MPVWGILDHSQRLTRRWKKSNKMASDSVLFEDFKFIIRLGQTLTFGTMVTVSCGTCCHGYYGNAIYLSLSMCKSYPLDP